MSTLISSYYDLVSQLPGDTVVTFHDVSWAQYEDFLKQVSEGNGLRVSYDDGTLQVMTLSPTHESYTRFIEKLVTAISLRLRINIRSFGSATMSRQKKRKGNEPDACFYVQTADAIGNRMELDFETDPPPDIVVEVDVHHDSRSKFSIYAAFGVSEIWRFDGQTLAIHIFEQGGYREAETSLALPMLTNSIMTGFLARLRDEGEFQTLLTFDEWLQSLS